MAISTTLPTNDLPRAIPIHELFAGHKVSRMYDDVQIHDLVVDSRKIKPRDLFCAIPGDVADGRLFINKAITAGAAAVVYELPLPVDIDEVASIPYVGIDGLKQKLGQIASTFFNHPSSMLRMIGVTGTNGKTTCVYLLAQAYELLGSASAVLGTLGVGKPMTMVKRDLTTSDAIQVQRDLYALQRDEIDTVCMEVSSHGLDQGRVNAVEFDIAVYTNLSQDHLDYHGDMQSYAATKAKLFQFDGLGCSVINIDDNFSADILQGQTANQVITYGLSGGDVSLRNLNCHIDGISFDLIFEQDVVPIRSPLLGEINAPNLLATAATLLADGFSLQEISTVMPLLQSPPGRMERFSKSGSATLVVDYSHTPDSLSRALQSLLPLSEGELWCVFGCGGDRDSGKRIEMGQAADLLAHKVVVTNDNPRTEDPMEIIAQACAGMKRSPAVIPDRRKAIEHAFENAAATDVILLAGKGHEETQTTGDQVIRLSDRQIAMELVGGLS